VRLIRLNDNLFLLNTKIFQEVTRKLTFKALLKYIQENHVIDINIIITLLNNCIDGSLEDINKYKKELDELLK